jgi:CHAT domain-containing protein
MQALAPVPLIGNRLVERKGEALKAMHRKLATLAVLLVLALARPAAGQDLANAVRAAGQIDPSGQPVEAEAAWRAVLAVAEAGSQPDETVLFTARMRIGDSYYYRGRPDQALEQYEAARARLNAAGLAASDHMSEALANMGVMHSAMGNPGRDVELQRAGLAIRVALYGPDDPRLAANYFNLGNALNEAGMRLAAVEPVERGARMRLANLAPEDPELFITLASAAGIMQGAERNAVGIEFAQQAMDLVTQHHPGHPLTGFVRGVLGQVLTFSGRTAEAVPILEQALDELAATMGQDSYLTAAALHNLAISRARQGQFDAALALMQGAIATGQRIPQERVRPLISGSNYAAEANRPHLAADLAGQALALLLEHVPDDAQLRATASAALALHLERLGETDRALPLMAEALALAERAEGPQSTRAISSAIHLGWLEMAAGDIPRGYARLSTAAERLVPALFEVITAPELGQDDNSYYDLFARAAQAAIVAEQPADAFRYVQLATYGPVAQASQQVAARAHLGEQAVALRRLQDLQQTLRATLREETAHLAAGPLAAATDSGRSGTALRREIEDQRRQLSASHPDLADLAMPRMVDLAGIQASLAPDQAVFLALPAQNATSLLLVRRDGVTGVVAPQTRGALRQQVAGVRAAIDQALTSGGALPAFNRTTVETLYAELFPAPIAEQLDGIRHLYIMASDVLAQVPFAMLARPGGAETPHWLVRDMALEVPASLAAIGNDTTRPVPSRAFAGIGAAIDLPQRLQNLPPLPGAANELQHMARVLGGEGTVLTGAAATEQALRALPLDQYRVLAFATHGLLSDEVDGVTEPALVLTPDAVGDGLLTASEVATLRLAADFVILSACNTAAGATRSAAPYTGLAQAFLYAGARSLLLSHWQVRDDAAAFLAAETVARTSAGRSRAEALRQATLALIDESGLPGTDHPAIWAPFLLIGS